MAASIMHSSDFLKEKLSFDAYALDNANSSTDFILSASVNIIEAISVTDKTPLDFGIIKSSKSGGTVVVTPLNKRIVNGGVEIDSSNLFHSAEFRIHGAADVEYDIDLPSVLYSTRQETKSVPKETGLKVVDLKSYSEVMKEQTKRARTNSQGNDTVYIGGTLIVPPNVSPGHYTVEVQMTVSY